MIENDDYIIWLEEFPLKYPSFYNDDWDYSKEQLTQKDKENLSALNMLYEIIDDYARGKNPEENYNDSKLSYYIKHDKTIFEIGFMPQQGTAFFCNRVQAVEDFIEFDALKKFYNAKVAKRVRK